MNSPPDYYKILEIPETDDIKIIRQAYRRLAALYHPDRDTSLEAARRFRDVTAAYHVLSNSQLRAEYRFHRRYENHAEEESTVEVRERRPKYDDSQSTRRRQASYVNDPWLTGLDSGDSDWRDHISLILARCASFILFVAYVIDWTTKGRILQASQFSDRYRDVIGVTGILLGAVALGLIGAPVSRKSKRLYASFWQKNLPTALRATGWVLLCSFPYLTRNLSRWLD